MSPSGVLRQLRYLLRTLTKTSSSAADDTLFGPKGVRVACDGPEADLMRLANPAIVLNAGQFTAEAENPRLGAFAIEAVLFSAISTDPWGAEAVFALLQNEERVVSLAGFMSESNGIEVSIRRTGGVRVTPAKTKPLAFRKMLIEAKGVGRKVEADDFNLPTMELTAASSNGTDVQLSWTRPNRYDLDSVSVRRSSSPITSISDGLEVVSSPTLTSFEDANPGTGTTWYYAAFYGFDPYESGSETHYSPAVSATAVVLP